MRTTNDWIKSNVAEHCESGVPFRTVLKPYKFTPMSFMDAAEFTAKKIAEDVKKPLYVLYSGGADSEFIVRLFHRLGIDFITVVIDTGMSDREVGLAYKTLKELGIEADVLKISEHEIVSFYVEEMYRKKRGTSIYAATMLLGHLYISSLGGFCITGDGPRRDDILEDMLFESFEFYPDLFDSDFTGFFCYTVEMTYAMTAAIDGMRTAEEYKSKTYGTVQRPKFKARYSQQTLNIVNHVLNTQSPRHGYNLGCYEQFLSYLDCWKKTKRASKK